MKTKHIFNIGLPILIMVTIVFASISKGEKSIIQTVAVLTGCVAFHFTIWIFSAISVVWIMKNKANDKCVWFRELSWEKDFYKLIKIRKWKRHLPTYAPKYYDFKSTSYENLIAIISQTEVVHEVAALFSLLSLFGIRWFSNVPIIAITAAIDFMINLVYVFLQRYNRMRLRKLIQ